MRTQNPPESYSLHMAASSLPSPKGATWLEMMTKPWKERCSSLQQQILLLNGRISALEERLGKHECPDCGESGDGVFIDSPSGDYRACNCCGHEWRNQ